jgi:hypothetical protein
MARNEALDYLRTSALLQMSLIHMWRYILGRSGVDAFVLSCGETAPFLFFVAFGATQHALLRRPRENVLAFFVFFGVISLLHDFYQFFFPVWEFFQFLWVSSLLVVFGSRLGCGRRHFLVLGAAVLIANAIVPLGVTPLSVLGPWDHSRDAAIALAQRLWILPGPFFPLPWVAVVFLGFAMGMASPPRGWHAFVLSVVGLIGAFAVGLAAESRPDSALALNLTLSKWAATSTYLLAGCCGTLLLYAVFDALGRLAVVRTYVYPGVRFVSDHLIEGAILHYPVVRLLTAKSFGWGITFRGARTLHWTGVVLLSVMNVVLLTILLKLVMLVWKRITWGGACVLDRIGWRPVAVTAALAWIVIQACFLAGAVRLGYLKWSAYAVMLGIALFYKYDKGRGTAGATQTVPAQAAARAQPV